MKRKSKVQIDYINSPSEAYLSNIADLCEAAQEPGAEVEHVHDARIEPHGSAVLVWRNGSRDEAIEQVVRATQGEYVEDED